MIRLKIATIDGPAGDLEVATFLCDLNEPLPPTAILVMHPHPIHGGSMENKVVMTIARAARDLGLAVVTFNFRGVGGSEGEWAGGVGEIDDAFAVASVMLKSGVSHLLLAGFSFGACVAAHLVPKIQNVFSNVQILDLIQVAPAIENFPIQVEVPFDVPHFILVNIDDDVVSSDAIIEFAKKSRADIVINPSGGHFFHGDLVRLKKLIMERIQHLGHQ